MKTSAMTLQKRALSFFNRVNDDEVFLLAASLAYTTGLAMAPFVIIMLSLTLILGESFDKSLITQISSLIGKEASQVVELVLKSVHKAPDSFGLSNVIEFVVLAASASTIFSQLRGAFNKIDHYEAPEKTSGFWIFIKDRLFCVQLVLGFAFLAVTSLFVSSALAALVPPADAILGQIVLFVVNLLVFVGIFTAIFRYLPSTTYPWRRCFITALVASGFFIGGKEVIGLYLGKVAVGSAYGAAGTLVVFLVWVYYTSLTLLLSYEATIEVIDQPSKKKE